MQPITIQFALRVGYVGTVRISRENIILQWNTNLSARWQHQRPVTCLFASVIFFGVRIRLGTVLGRFSIIYFRGLRLRIRVRVWVRVRASVMVWVRVRVGLGLGIVSCYGYVKFMVRVRIRVRVGFGLGL